MQDLDPILFESINSDFHLARKYLEEGNGELAISTASAAWGRLPEPKFEWDISKVFTYALAGLYRDTKHFQEAVSLMEALFASSTVLPYQDGPYFILGTIYYEMGDMEKAAYWLGEANQISKGRCFREQPEKYKKFIKG